MTCSNKCDACRELIDTITHVGERPYMCSVCLIHDKGMAKADDDRKTVMSLFNEIKPPV